MLIVEKLKETTKMVNFKHILMITLQIFQLDLKHLKQLYEFQYPD